MISFAALHKLAAKRKGGAKKLEALLPEPASPRKLARTPDARLLSQLSKNVFRAGFNWRVVDHMWPAFEKALAKFDVPKTARMTDARFGKLVSNPELIRNRQKLESIVENARFMVEVAAEHGSFGRYLAKWPTTDIVGLWAELKRRGSRLGGATAQYFLREVGKDTFMLTRSTNAALVTHGIVGKAPTSRRDLKTTQEAFNTWAEQSGRPLCQVSRVLACSVPD